MTENYPEGVERFNPPWDYTDDIFEENHQEDQLQNNEE